MKGIPSGMLGNSITERFTGNKGDAYILRAGIKESDRFGRYFGKAADKLAHYEEIEEQGRLLELPCKIGTYTYHVVHESVINHYGRCSNCTDDLNNNVCDYFDEKTCSCLNRTANSPWQIVCKGFELEHLSKFNKTVFLSSKEAERKRKELTEGEKLKELKLKYIGNDSMNRPVYEDETGKLWKDTCPYKDKNPRLCSSYRNAFDGEPDVPMDVMKCYENVRLVFTPERRTW